jgi:hypothetical protein
VREVVREVADELRVVTIEILVLVNRLAVTVERDVVRDVTDELGEDDPDGFLQ